MSSSMAFLYASLIFRLTVAMPGAMPSMGPMPTPMGLMASIGFSPRPTEAPGSNGVPLELRRRANVIYPPPERWCGFVDGDYDNPLTCRPGLTCVNSLDFVGCCTATTGTCTNLYTTCAGYYDTCTGACLADSAIRKCDKQNPYCGTYRFLGGTYLFNCDTTTNIAQSVEFLNDYYITAIGSTLASETTNVFQYTDDFIKIGPTGSATDTDTDTYTSTPTSSSYSNYDYDSDDSGGGLSTAAIRGIAAGAAIVGIAILAFIVFFCVRQRRRRRLAAASVPYANAPYQQQQPPHMQQQQTQGPPPKAFDGYQSVPQQDQQPPYTKYPTPSSQLHQPTGYFPPPTAASAISPQPTGTTPSSDPRLSTAAPSLLSPVSPSLSATDPRQSAYKPPLSPTITEVDATMGNPGVPSPSNNNNGGHVAGAGGSPMEVDGTMGNPGVPIGGHGIQSQLQPGGSPSAQEIDGQVGSNMMRPFSTDGPFELGHGDR